MKRVMEQAAVAVVAGVRTPLGKADGALAGMDAVALGVAAARELLARTDARPDAVVVGNVIQPSDAANIARVIALQAGVARDVPAHTVQRNCASGMQAVTDGAMLIASGCADLVLVGGVESMTRAPLLFHDEVRRALARWRRSRGTSFLSSIPRELVRVLTHLKPRAALMEGLTDPTVHMNMGQTAELLADEFGITREAQDRYALESHQRADAAWNDGRFDDEVMPLFAPPKYDAVVRDEGIRPQQSMEALAGLRPVFSKPLGTVTAGNSSQISDGAAMLLLARRELAEAEGWPLLGYLRDWCYAGCDPARMGLGPVFASHRLLSGRGMTMAEMARVEINEAFAAQVLACREAMASRLFHEQNGLRGCLGAPEDDRLNVWGGAIAIGHPVGMTGARLILALCRQLRDAPGFGLATLCIGGGQGGAVLLEGAP